MTLDILVLLLPHLTSRDALALFETCSSTDILESKDSGVQKRGYKILTKLVDGGRVTVDASSVLQQLEQSVDGLAPAAKKVRVYSRVRILFSLSDASRTECPSFAPW